MITQTKTLIVLAAAGLALTGAVAHADNDKGHHYDKYRSHHSRGHAYGRYNANRYGNNGNHYANGQYRDNGRVYVQHRDNDRNYRPHQDDNDRVYPQPQGNDNQGRHRDDTH